MKKILILLAALVLLFASCAEKPFLDDRTPLISGGEMTETPDGESTEAPADETDVPKTGRVSNRSYSSWADWTEDEKIMQGIVNAGAFGKDDGKIHLPLYMIDSEKALGKFILDYGDVYSMQASYDTFVGFAYATDHCNADFFEEKILLVAYMEASSGSFRYNVGRVSVDDGELLVEIIQRNDPEAYTADMSGWLMTAEVKRADVEKCTSFDAVYEGIHVSEFAYWSEPPILTVFTPYDRTEAINGGFHWYERGGGGVIADSDYPYTDDFLDNVHYLPNADFYSEDAVYGRLAFDFARQPDKIYMSRQRIEDERNHDLRFDVDVSVTDEGITFPLNTSGCYTYSLSVTWEKVDGVGGSVDYYFCVGDREGYYDQTCSPQLFVAVRQFELEAKTVSDGWTYPSQNGTENARDSSDVLKEYQLENLPLISTDAYGYGQQAKLVFDFDGEVKVKVRRWNMEAAKYAGFDAAVEDVEVNDGMTIELKRRGTYVYEVTAVWEMVDGVGGKMTYGFYEGLESTQS